ncbi:hypothetical protein ACWAV8_004411, partial [Salmonella enterica subsp. enterica serovar Braenderup]
IQHVAILCRKIKQALFVALVCLWGESTDAEAQQLGSQHRKNNNPRTRGDFFYLNSLRRVLFYGANDGSCYQCHLSLSPREY